MFDVDTRRWALQTFYTRRQLADLLSLAALNIRHADGPDVDAFGRARVSQGVTLFDNFHEYQIDTLLWQTSLSTGTVTFDSTNRGVTLSTGGVTSGNYAILQTYQYFRYQPGKSQTVELTGTIGAATANVTKRYGYFDANNGLFFEQAGSTGMRVVVRVGGADTGVAQTAWNIDKMDGGGPSRVTLDFTKAQIMHIDFQFLGVGRVRFGWVVDGLLYYCHEVLNANNIAVPYMQTANLPVRVEIRNTDTAGGATTCTHICTTVISEGGFEEERGIPRAIANGTSGISVTTRRAVLSIQPRTTVNGIANRGTILLRRVEVYASGQPITWAVIHNGTLGGSPSWAGTSTLVLYDVAGTTVTGGTQIAAGYLAASASTRASSDRALNSRLPLTLDLAGSAQQVLSVVCTSIPGTAATVHAAIEWEEIY